MCMKYVPAVKCAKFGLRICTKHLLKTSLETLPRTTMVCPVLRDTEARVTECRCMVHALTAIQGPSQLHCVCMFLGYSVWLMGNCSRQGTTVPVGSSGQQCHAVHSTALAVYTAEQ
jgi:hypothetical protein